MTRQAFAGVAGHFVDLSHHLLPGQEQYTLEVAPRQERGGPEGDIMSVVYMWSHTGTHLEAPRHFRADGSDTADLPLEACLGPAVVLDFRTKQTNEAISREEIEAAGRIERGDAVLLFTGRQHLYRTPQSHDRPYLTEAACRWLVEDRQIRLLGTDSSGFEVRGIATYPNHRLLTTAGIPVLECLRNLGGLAGRRVWLIALPLPVRGLDACPVRAVAFVPEAVP